MRIKKNKIVNLIIFISIVITAIAIVLSVTYDQQYRKSYANSELIRQEYENYIFNKYEKEINQINQNLLSNSALDPEDAFQYYLDIEPEDSYENWLAINYPNQQNLIQMNSAVSLNITNFSEYENHFINEPMIGFLSEDTYQVNIRTVSDKGDYTIKVRYGTDSSLSQYTETNSVTADNNNKYTAEINLTGLNNNEQYYYQVFWDNANGYSGVGPIHQFHTKRDTGDSFKFGIIGDPRQGETGDPTNIYPLPTPFHGIMERWKAFKMDDYDFTVSLGDDWNSSSMYAKYRSYFLSGNDEDYFLDMISTWRDQMDKVSHSLPHHIALGNHEFDLNYKTECVIFDEGRICNPRDHSAIRAMNEARKKSTIFPPGDFDNQGYYSFEWGDGLFLVINTVDRIGLLPYDSGYADLGSYAQFEWIEQQLSQTDKKWKIVFMQHPVVYGKDGDLPPDDWNNKYNADQLRRLFSDYDVDAVFYGDKHGYYCQKYDYNNHGLFDEKNEWECQGQDKIMEFNKTDQNKGTVVYINSGGAGAEWNNGESHITPINFLDVDFTKDSLHITCIDPATGNRCCEFNQPGCDKLTNTAVELFINKGGTFPTYTPSPTLNNDPTDSPSPTLTTNPTSEPGCEPCNADLVTISLNKSIASVGETFTFELSGQSQGTSYVGDRWDDNLQSPYDGGLAAPCNENLGYIPLSWSDGTWSGSIDCVAENPGNYIFEHRWQNSADCPVCSKTQSYMIIAGTSTTPNPTNAPLPSNTPNPTNTIVPTSTLIPTNTPVPGNPTPWIEVNSNIEQNFDLVEMHNASSFFSLTYNTNVLNIPGTYSNLTSSILNTSDDYEFTGIRVSKGTYNIDYYPADEWEYIFYASYHNFVNLKSQWNTGRKSLNLTFISHTPSPTGCPSMNTFTTTPGPTDIVTQTPTISFEPEGCSKFDLVADDQININDFVLFRTDYGSQGICSSIESRSDFQNDCDVDISDFILFLRAYNIYNNGDLPDYPAGTCWQGTN